jgi:nucleoside-diphosphate-sugar epimerase
MSDIGDSHASSESIQRADVIFNLAGATSHLDSMTAPLFDLHANVTSQLSFLETVRKLNPKVRIVFGSTRQIYGKPRYLPVDEKHPLVPVDVNGIHKLSAELYHQLFDSVYGLKSTVVRLTNTYGPRMRVKDARQTFLGLWLHKVLKDETIDVWGGEQLRDFSFIDDTVEALLLLGQHKDSLGVVYNVGGDEVLSLREIAECLVSICGKGKISTHPFPEERRRIDIGDYYADSSKLQNGTGWSPQVSFVQGIEKTAEFYQKHLHEYCQ